MSFNYSTDLFEKQEIERYESKWKTRLFQQN